MSFCLTSSFATSSNELESAPAQVAVEYETRTFKRGFQNDTTPYQGWPTDEIDTLWEELYSSTSFVTSILSW
jgi:hypothetical protein